MHGETGTLELEDRLAELERLGLSRRLRLVSGPQGPTVLLDGQPVLLLCSNNYLGLADHPEVREAAAEAAMRWGVGAGASRLISGTMTVHRRLEERLADFTARQSCLLFGSGYLANLGVIGALAGRGDTVFSDELNHASIVDGCRLSRAEVVVYRHGDCEHLLWSMRHHGGRREGQGRRVIATDSIFSMDGDVAPLEQLVELAQAAGARIVVDEAHAIGTYGPGGRGALAAAGLDVEAMDDNRMLADFRESAEQEARGGILVHAIAEREGITASDADVQKRVAELAASRNETPKKLRADLDKEQAMPQLEAQIREQKTLDMLISQAKITDEDPATSDKLIVTPDEAREEAEAASKRKKKTKEPTP